MLLIPFEIRNSERGPLVLVIVLEKENLDRMKKADPLDVNFADYHENGTLFLDRPMKQLDLVIAYEEDKETLLEFARKNDILGLLGWIERGRKILAGDLAAPVKV